MRREKRRKEYKSRLAILLLVFAMFIIVGSMLALFSDFVLGQLFGTAGTLNINITTRTEKTRYHMIGGDEHSQTDDEIQNLNPGDIIEIVYGITNEGNKSAWIRTLMNFTIGINAQGNQPITPGAFRLYPLTANRNDIRAGTAGTPLAISTPLGFNFISEVEIINGGLDTTAREVEISGLEGEQIIGFQIYFVSTAPMEYQGVSLTSQIKVQAMQYRNNSNPEWQNVVSKEFILGEPQIVSRVATWDELRSTINAVPNSELYVIGIANDMTAIRCK
ncbi:MAG: hypothetical protein FWC68_02990 [Oscillospiraceae bacterium]|nr:hypothetical protein [Oscillospiraceae bacterium]